MEREERQKRPADIMTLLLWFLGGYLGGCLAMNLYWRCSERLALDAFRISVYDGSLLQTSRDGLFWKLFRRDLGVLSLLFVSGLFSWGYILVCAMLAGGGFVLGVLTSGILLSEGMYWWLKGMVWMLPCFLCSGSVLAGEMYSVWKGAYRLQRYRQPAMGQLVSYVGHILLIVCLTAMVCRAESTVLLSFFSLQ